MYFLMRTTSQYLSAGDLKDLLRKSDRAIRFLFENIYV